MESVHHENDEDDEGRFLLTTQVRSALLELFLWASCAILPTNLGFLHCSCNSCSDWCTMISCFRVHGPFVGKCYAAPGP